MMTDLMYGDALAQDVAKRIARPAATEAAIAALPTSEFLAGRIFVAIAEGTLWICTTTGTAPSRLPGQGVGLYTCATGVAVGEWVYVSAANTVAEADADDVTKRPAIGVVVAKPSTTSCLVQMSGEYTTSGLTAGAPYFLSATTAGTITAAQPAGHAQLVGVAKSTTVLVIVPQIGQVVGSDWIDLTVDDFKECDASGDVGDTTANGGLLASDTTPILRGNAAETQEISWATGNTDKIRAQKILPPNFSGASDVTGELWVYSGSADPATFTVETGWDGGALVSDTADDTATVSGTLHKITFTVAAADVPNAASLLTIILTPAAHATDAIQLLGGRLLHATR